MRSGDEENSENHKPCVLCTAWFGRGRRQFSEGDLLDGQGSPVDAH